MTLSFFPTAEQRPSQHISLGTNGDKTPATQLAKRAAVSGYVNLNAAGQYSEAAGERGTFSPALSLSSAVRVVDLVIENEATVASGGFTRQGTRAVYDDQSRAIRYTVGDITPATAGSQAGSSFLGVSIQKSYEKLQPQRSIRPTGERSFRLDRPSEVDIIINGQVIRRLQMPPGDHDVSELPLKSGMNEVTLEITDDTRQTLKFTVFFDHTLLAPGISEWGVAAGYRSVMAPARMQYFWGEPAVTGYYEEGITENFTATALEQSTAEITVLGLLGVSPTRFGRIALEADGSIGQGKSPGGDWVLTYTPDTLFKYNSIPGTLQMAAQYQTAAFTPIFALPGTEKEGFSINGFYSFMLTDDFEVALSGSTSVGPAFGTQNIGAGLSVTKQLAANLSTSLTLSYANTPAATGLPATGPLSILGRLNVKLTKETELSVAEDGNATVVEVSTEGKAEDGRYAAKAQIERDTRAATGDVAQDQVSFSANYSGPLFDVATSRSSQLYASNHNTISDVSTLSGSAGVAFADNRVAVGRSITDSFAIVTPSEGLNGAGLRIQGGEGDPRARSGILSSMLVSDLAAYSDFQLPIEVDNAPDGADVGSGVFDVRPDYKSGYALKVGSEYGVTVIGMMEFEGHALALVSGLAKEEGVPNPNKVVIFTNAAGRFCAQGLKPGVWRLEMLGDPTPCFRLTVPEKTSGILDAGVLAQRCS
jgi:outer membrane usher protein